jgi:CBS domain-containing protein
VPGERRVLDQRDLVRPGADQRGHLGVGRRVVAGAPVRQLVAPDAGLGLQPLDLSVDDRPGRQAGSRVVEVHDLLAAGRVGPGAGHVEGRLGDRLGDHGVHAYRTCRPARPWFPSRPRHRVRTDTVGGRCGKVEPFRRDDNLDEEGGRVLIEHILHRKGTEVAAIPADAPVSDAVVRLRERNIGALVVTAPGGTDERPELAGILSERDIVRAIADAAPDPAAVLRRPVSDLMSTDLATCAPRATVDELMRLMTDRRIRHIPVLDEGRLAGIVSIGDVVKSRIDELETETETLHDYLSGR